MTPADSQLGQGKLIFPPRGPPQVNMLTNMQNRKQIAIHFRQHDGPISDSFYCSYYFFLSFVSVLWYSYWILERLLVLWILDSGTVIWSGTFINFGVFWDLGTLIALVRLFDTLLF